MSLDSAVASLVNRLEAVTHRLVAVEKQLAEGGGSHSSASSGGASGGESSSASVQEYEDLINQFVKPFAELSSKIGDKAVADQGSLFLAAVNSQRDLLKTAAASKKPSDDQLQKLLQPTGDLMQKIVALKDTNRASKFFNNLSTVSEGVQALGWVAVAPTPGPFVGDMRGGSEFYSNRLLKEFKGNNQVQVDWVTAFNSFLKELQTFIKKHHTTGLTWNPRGGDASSASSVSTSGASTSGGPPPPPGPAPPPPPPVDTGSSGPDMSGVFSALSKGEGVTSGLRKVTDDMKTKNRSDKSSVVPATAVKSSAPSKAAKETVTTKPPKFTLEGNKWLVENQVNNRSIVINDTEPKQTCYIYKCNNSTVQIKGKINAITVDDCTKVAVVFENVVSSFEIVNSRSIEVQVTGKVPSFAIDKTAGAQIYLSKGALETEIVTSKSSEMNVLLPSDDPEQDMIEIAIPEQYKTTVKNNKLVTEIVQHV